MANTYGGINEAIIAQEGLESFKAALAPVNAFSLNIDSNPMRKGATVETNLITGMSAAAFSNDYETGDSTTTQKQVTLGTHVFRSVHLTDIEGGKTNFDIMVANAKEAAYAVGKKIFQDLTDNFTVANFSTERVVAVASFDADDVADLAQDLDDADVPETNRSLILTNGGINALRKDNAIQDASALGSDAVIREGAVGRILGFDIYRTNAFTSTITGGTEDTYGIACHPSALAVAIRPVVPGPGATEAGVRHGVEVDADTGIALSWRSHYAPKTGTSWMTFEALYGSVVGQSTGAARIVSEA